MRGTKGTVIPRPPGRRGVVLTSPDAKSYHPTVRIADVAELVASGHLAMDEERFAKLVANGVRVERVSATGADITGRVRLSGAQGDSLMDFFSTPLCFLCRGAIATRRGYCKPCAVKMDIGNVPEWLATYRRDTTLRQLPLSVDMPPLGALYDHDESLATLLARAGRR